MDTALRDNIDWVGYVDWTVRDFHGYHTHQGSTYNAYLVQDEKTALIDTVKVPYARNFLKKVADRTALDKIAYIVCNHAEPDHSGSLGKTLAVCPAAELVCNKKCRKTLEQHYDTTGWRWRVVENGEKISLGARTLRFIDTPMAHWPESMFTYVEEEKLLFSMDAFGQHYASSMRFDDDAILADAKQEARTYYANILMPYGKQVGAALGHAAELDIETIAPSHGVIWRNDVDWIIEAYKRWVACRPRCKVLVIYDTMWQSTATMARAILDGASKSDVEVKLFSIRASDLTTLATEVLEAGAIAFGSPTLNRTMMPQMAALLSYLKGLRPMGKSAVAFGSYGWAKGGAKEVDAALRELKFDMLSEAIQVQFVPGAETLEQCRKAGRMLADKAIEMTNDKL